jgi:hypothetical protein
LTTILRPLDLIGFITAAASLLQNNIRLFQSVLGLIPLDRAKVLYTVEKDSVELLTVTTSALQIDSPAIQSTEDVKKYLNQEEITWSYFTCLPPRWAGSVAELVQTVSIPSRNEPLTKSFAGVGHSFR